MFKIGAEWRIWDLHVHTPESIENNYKKTADLDTWERFISDLESLPKDIKVIGINDYLFLDGYKKVIDYKKKGRLNNLDLILPVVELRLARFCGNKQFKRINYHIIFSNELSTDVIEKQFLNTLSSSYKLDPESNQTSWDGFITKENLIRLGEKIISSVPEDKRGMYKSPLIEGFNNLNLEIDSINQALSKAKTFFDGKYLTAIGKTEWDELKWDDTSIAEKKTIINSVDFVFTASESVEKYNKGKDSLIKNGVKCILLDCSDSHNNIDCKTSKDRLGNCFTWLKADPTFDGLKQVLIEPDDRIFIGERPQLFDNIEKNKTKYIDKLTINSVDKYKGENGRWFENIEIPFNKELVAIIGNKGNGKSAIADIIAHCCNVHEQKYFSFLHVNKFRKGGLANNFKASVRFCDNSLSETENLSDIPIKENTNVEPLVKYIPQGYFEIICNDLQKEEDFKKEIENVVFQYIDSTENMGASNFSELIRKKTKIVDEEISELKSKLSLINKDIVLLESKENPKYEEWLLSEIEKKDREIQALTKPTPVKKPDSSSPENLKILGNISTVKNECDLLNKEIEKCKEQKKELIANISSLETIISKLVVFREKLVELKNDIEDRSKLLGIDSAGAISFNINTRIFEKELSQRKKELGEIQNLLAEDSCEPNNLNLKLNEKLKELSNIQLQLEGPEREYQQYLRKNEEYETQRKSIEGTENIPNTLCWLKKELDYIKSDLQKDICLKTTERSKITHKIVEQKQLIINIYREIKSKIDNKIKENEDLLTGYNIKIEASLSVNNSFNEEFLHFIKQNVKGSFKGRTDGEALIKKTISNANFQECKNIISFCDSIIHLLKYDFNKNDERRFTEEQTDDVIGLYNFLYSLDYLQYNYQLKQGDKELPLLSPGEKGALLLVFYLLLDMDNKPLILDQPEDNLDNDSVANILVEFIKRAKKKRQIIMVTHNPNLAVVADAEQVVYVKIDKQNNCLFSTESGSIENPRINRHIVDVLEAAMPAFRKRDKKYISNCYS